MGKQSILSAKKEIFFNSLESTVGGGMASAILGDYFKSTIKILENICFYITIIYLKHYKTIKKYIFFLISTKYIILSFFTFFKTVYK